MHMLKQCGEVRDPNPQPLNLDEIFKTLHKIKQERDRNPIKDTDYVRLVEGRWPKMEAVAC